MYIGPWQEFKLARILQIKEKMDKEAEEDNQLPPPQIDHNNGGQKAYSVGGKIMANAQTHSNIKADSRVNQVKQQVMTDNKFKYRMDPEFAPPQKKVPLLKSTYSDPNGGVNRQKPPPSREVNSRREQNRKKSPTNSISGYSYAGSNTHSTQYTTGALNQIKKPS